ncbi:MAG TPA: hypothetical protein PKJ99_13925 [Thermoanaerobaculales bacterium]|nr:hypothetical protein [Thermoanaerobaculales bacterium]
MRPLYKTQFRIEPDTGRPQQAVADEVMASVRAWIRSHYDHVRETAPAPVEVMEITRRRDQPFQMKESRLESGEFHRAVYWTHPAADGGHFNWTTLCDLAFAEGKLDFQFTLGVESDDYSAVPRDLRPGRPRLIPDLLGNPHWQCISGGTELPLTEKTITVHDVDDFCTENLYGPGRKVALVLLSPTVDNGRHYAVKPKDLALRLAGTAKVVALRDGLTLKVINQYLGPNFSLEPDAVRVFSPNFWPTDDPYDHPQFLGETMRAKKLMPTEFADFLFGRLAERAVVSVSDPPALAAFRRLARNQHQSQLESLQKQVEESEKASDELLNEAKAQVETLLGRVAALDAELETRNDKIRALEFGLKTAQSNIAELSRAVGVGVSDFAESPTEVVKGETVAEIVGSAACALRQLEFLKSAIDSAAEVPRNFEFPDRVKAHLEALDVAAAARDADGRLGTGWKEYFRDIGMEYKSKISEKTRNKWGGEYTFDYRGKSELFKEHFTIGAGDANKCLSIHFSTRLRKDKIVVAYVGRHLTNTTT